MRKDREWLIGIHLSQLLGFVIPLGGLIAPIVIWITKRTQIERLEEDGKEIINFQISLFLLSLLLVGFGFFSNFVMGTVSVFDPPTALSAPFGFYGILSLSLLIVGAGIPALAAMKVSQGGHYRYPVILKVIH